MLTFAQAKKDSLIKWDYARKTGCNYDELNEWLGNNHIKIFKYAGKCGFCERDQRNQRNCLQCELYMLWGEACDDDGSLFYEWTGILAKEKRKEYAEKIYQDILSLEEK